MSAKLSVPRVRTSLKMERVVDSEAPGIPGPATPPYGELSAPQTCWSIGIRNLRCFLKYRLTTHPQSRRAMSPTSSFATLPLFRDYPYARMKDLHDADARPCLSNPCHNIEGTCTVSYQPFEHTFRYDLYLSFKCI
jgi:hypothetical protein